MGKKLGGDHNTQLSNLWWMPNSVSKGFDTAMKTGSSRRFKRYPTTYRGVSRYLYYDGLQLNSTSYYNRLVGRSNERGGARRAPTKRVIIIGEGDNRRCYGSWVSVWWPLGVGGPVWPAPPGHRWSLEHKASYGPNFLVFWPYDLKGRNKKHPHTSFIN